MDIKLYRHLLKKIKEPQLVKYIATMSVPSFPVILKRDIQSYIFTWSIFNYIYVPWATEVTIETLEDFAEENIKWQIYNDILKSIHELIMRYHIKQNPFGKINIPELSQIKRNEKLINFVDEERFNKYWCQRIFSSSWDILSPHEGIGCSLVRESLDETEMLNLIQKFLLHFLPIQRLSFLQEIGIYSVLRDLTV